MDTKPPGKPQSKPTSKSAVKAKTSIIKSTTSQREAIEVERWVQATQRVLNSAQKPLHYLDIKRIIAENKLIPLGLKTSLEVALLTEVQRPGARLAKVDMQSGVFRVTTEAERTAHQEPPQPKPKPPPPVQAPKPPQQAKPQPPPKTPPQKTQPPPKVKVKSTHSGGVNSIEKYRNKYLRLKKFIKHMVFLNAAVCDEVVKVDTSVAQVREQRRYLLRRLQQYQVMPEVLPPPVPKVAPTFTAASLSPGVTTVKSPTPQTPPISFADVKPDLEKLKMKKKGTPNPKKKTHKDLVSVIAGGELPKPKAKKSKASSAKRLVVPILLDNTGRPIFPIELGPLTIHSLGEITTDRSKYHSVEHIYPVGFCSTRVYCTVDNPAIQTLYTCKILDCGMAPKFEISPDDAPEQVISCDSADECHTRLLAYINNARGIELVTPEPRGAEFFGFSHPTVQNLIQCCPGARKCSGYKWVRFEVCRTDPTEATNFFHDDPVIDFEALYQSQKFQQAIEQSKQMQQSAAVLEPTSSLRSLLTSGPLLQNTHT